MYLMITSLYVTCDVSLTQVFTPQVTVLFTACTVFEKIKILNKLRDM